MESVLFLVEKFAYWHKAKQLAVLTNRLNNLQITVQVLKEGEKYRNLFAKNVNYKPQNSNCYFFSIFPPQYLYQKIVTEKYDIAIAWTEGKCVRILSGCPYEDTVLYCMIHNDLTEAGYFTKGFHSWDDAVKAYRKFRGSFVSDPAFCKPTNSVTGIKPSKIQVIPPLWDGTEYIKENFYHTYTTPETLQICSVGEKITPSAIKRLYKIHIKLLSEGYWHRMIVVAGKKELAFPSENFIHIPWTLNSMCMSAASDIFLCLSNHLSSVDEMIHCLHGGIPIIATKSLLTDSILKSGKYGMLTEDKPECIQSAIRAMLTNPTIRYTYAKSTQIYIKQSSSEIVNLFLKSISANTAEPSKVFVKYHKKIENRA